jgi:hypothetical protein
MMEMLQILKYCIRSARPLQFMEDLLISTDDAIRMLDLTPEQVDELVLQGRLHELREHIRPRV